ncbi:MAG: tryptophan--tRNA ligase [Thermomicrobiales bacterium]
MVIEQLEEQRTARRPATRRQRVLSGIKPSGTSHIGNYLGAIRNWVNQQASYDNVFCIVNLHALTLPTTRDGLMADTITMANTLLASGIDPAQSILFAQADVTEHAELSWMLSSVTQFGELRRMTQFKDKAGDKDEAVSAALFTYPVLQAADILLYDADLVPVGEDQKQHVEITRDIAERFNARYGETFVVPKPDIKPEGARIMSLDEPTKKMSKSTGGPNSKINLTDDPDAIIRKIRRAVTDSGSDVTAGPEKPAISNLLSIYSLFSGQSVYEVEQQFVGKGYGAFKQALGELIVESLRPIRQRLPELEADPSFTRDVLRDGAERARAQASAKMDLVRDRMGLMLGR